MGAGRATKQLAGVSAKCYEELSTSGTARTLHGPTSERNTYTLLPRERMLFLADNQADVLTQ